MAVATIKDLLDPLTKIQAATESSAASLDAFTAATAAQMQGDISILKKLDRLIEVSSSTNMNTRDLAMYKNSREQTKLLGIIAKSKGKVSGGKESGSKGTGKLKEGAASLKSLGQGAVALAKGLILFRIVPKKTILKFQDFVKDQIEIWEKSKPKKMEKGAKAMLAMGNAIYTFAKSLALAALLLIPAAIGIPMLYLATMLLVPLFVLLGKRSKQIRKGARALDRIGDAMKSFAVGLAVFALATMFILMKPVILLGMVASLLLIGGTVAILGRFSKTIRKGSVALLLMGIGLAAFGIGYGLFALAVTLAAPSVGDVLLQAAVLIGIGIATALLGMVWTHILKGAVALALMGIGLAIFGLGYIPFAHATKDTTMGDIGVQGALLLMLGLEFAAAGFGALFIIPGAAAFAAIGGALMLLAPGLKAIKNVKWTQADSTDLVTLLAGVKTAFLGTTNTEGGATGFFKNIGNALGSTVKGPMMISAAAGYAAAGIALTKLSVGLKAFKSVDWDDDQSTILATALTGISGAFASAGGEAPNPGGVFGAIFGNAFSPNATEKGIDSVMSAGKALTNIAEGLKSFQKLIDSGVEFGDPNREGGPLKGTLAYAVINTVGFVKQAFAAIGGADQSVESGGFFSGLFGIKSTATEEGIRSVKGAGTELNNIAKGLEGFQKLIESKVNFGDPANPQLGTLAYAVINTVGFVQQAFAAIGSQKDVDKGGFFGGLFGIKQNAVQKGIQSVSGAGEELSKIADAISTFSGIKNPKGTASRIKEVLTLVGDAFASIGGKENTDSKSSLFGLITWDENKIQNGIDAVDGAGEALTNIAAGLKAFGGDTQPQTVATSIGTLLTSIGTAFSDLYATNPFIAPQLHDFSTFIVTLGNVAEKGLLDKAADGISKIADSINKIDIDKTVAFGDLFKSSAKLSEDNDAYKSLAKAVEDIRDIMQEQKAPGLIDRGLNAIGLGSDKAAAPAAATTGADPMKKLNSTLGRLENAITALPTAIQTMKLEVSIPGQ